MASDIEADRSSPVSFSQLNIKTTPVRADTEADRSSPISFSRFNIKAIPARIKQTRFGKIRAFNTFTKLEWVYLSLSLLALTVSFGITAQRLSVEDLGSSDFTFALLLIFTIIFCYHYVIHGTFTERWDEILVFIVSNGIVFVYCIVNYVRDEEQELIKLVRLIFVCIFSPILIGMGLVQSVRYCKSNNLIYYTVGGMSSLQDACSMFFICSSLLKFDFQLQLSMLILVMGSGVLSMSLTQKVILASGIPITLFVIVTGYVGLRCESKVWMIIFYIVSLSEPGYVIYKFYYAAMYGKEDRATYESTFVCGYFTLAVWIVLIISTAYFVYKYFGIGLKEKMFGEKKDEPNASAVEAGANQQQTVPQESETNAPLVHPLPAEGTSLADGD